MFDAHIQYYAYDNLEKDEFGVGLLGNKDDWISRINRWNENDGIKTRFTVEDWDDLDCDGDFRGCVLAEIEPEDSDYIVTWLQNEDENSLRIDSKRKISWENNPQNAPSVPRWAARLKNTLFS